MLQFRFAAESDTGRVRENNEDAGFAGPYLLCVADGVGGAAAGEVASATTSYVVSARALAAPGYDPLRLLAAATEEAHHQLVIGVDADPDRLGMATTLTAILTDGVRTAMAHVGDSRAYLLRDGGFTQLSHDHTMVQAMVDAGRMTPEEATASPHRNVVLQAVDALSTPTPDLLWLDLRPGDRLLLCSDGLSDVLQESALATLLTVPSRRLATSNLIQAALDGGSRDNVTAIVADVIDGSPVAGNGMVLGAATDPYHLVDPAAVRPLRSA
ncbi:PP2C family protein-serine/threonine phosphatase [Nocardioides bizhenqiangii]|uniref:Protein phosphatase 2C domain-containing protein n=1 Tax=Nocardioides bizhenqiangii TaxID=3095076 RepID=A0ABZ0ZMA2_9ACTN|nr:MULTISPECIES: protein phosphatase 2C domain-containing protein [unclassified Nocardioides]MDZ5621174.1 protein phosphatase 2C domain-containing protein [Nocardioides sp. HM23]WQQ25434.1 protein phosphatase 2C domain-containing protein [Nocardioides sp. HM61]